MTMSGDVGSGVQGRGGLRVPVEAVIFDLDGTLAETHGMAIDLIGEAIVHGGGPELGPDEIMTYFGRNERGIFEAAVGMGWEASWDYYLGEYVQRHQAVAEPFPGITGLLAGLDRAGVALGVITAKTATTGRLSLEVLGIDGYFSEVRGGAKEGVTKRRDITALVDLWSVKPGEVVYVGDTISDVVEARAAGVVPIAAGWSSFAARDALTAANPDELFETVDAFADWLRGQAS